VAALSSSTGFYLTDLLGSVVSTISRLAVGQVTQRASYDIGVAGGKVMFISNKPMVYLVFLPDAMFEPMESEEGKNTCSMRIQIRFEQYLMWESHILALWLSSVEQTWLRDVYEEAPDPATMFDDDHGDLDAYSF
jgi:hypothetical protein